VSALPAACGAEEQGGRRQRHADHRTVVVSIDPELLETLIDMEEIDAESVKDCTDESVMEFYEST
jgi:hypothetical protein